MTGKKSNHLFFLFGDEDFLIEENHRGIVKGLSSTAGPDPTLETLSDDDATPPRILEATQALSLWGGAKCITVKNPAFLDSPEPKSKFASKSEPLESDEDVREETDTDWWNQIPAESTVIFWIDGNPDRRRRIVKELMAACDVRESKAFSPWEADQAVVWIMKRMEGQGRRIDPAAAELLVTTTGTTLRPLIQELEKLSLYAGPKESITVAHVELLAHPGAVAAFALSNALRERQLAESLIVLERMFQEREEPVRILGQLAAQFRMIAQVKALSDARLDISRMASQLISNPAYVRRCLASAKLFQLSELKEILYKMHDIDLLLKTTMISPRTLLEELMTFICRGTPVSETVYA